jgi:hypothetical protein
MGGNTMKYFIGIEKDGRIKFTTDRDCLSPQIITFKIAEYNDDNDLINTIREICRADASFQNTDICIDTENTFTEDKAINI